MVVIFWAPVGTRITNLEKQSLKEMTNCVPWLVGKRSMTSVVKVCQGKFPLIIFDVVFSFK